MTLEQLTCAARKFGKMTKPGESGNRAPHLKEHLQRFANIRPSDPRDTHPSAQDVGMAFADFVKAVQNDPNAIKEVLALQD